MKTRIVHKLIYFLVLLIPFQSQAVTGTHMARIICLFYSLRVDHGHLIEDSGRWLQTVSTEAFDPEVATPKFIFPFPAPFGSRSVRADIQHGGYMESNDSDQLLFRVSSGEQLDQVSFHWQGSPAGSAVMIRGTQVFDISTWLAYHCSLNVLQ